MNLTTDERRAVEEAKVEAHRLATRPDGSVSTPAAAEHFVTLLGEIEGADPQAIGAYLRTLSIKGAKKVMADWRRRHRMSARTAKGTAIRVPRYAGTRRPTDTGGTEYVQMALPLMSVDELRTHKDKLVANRDTLSVEIRLVSDLIAVCESEGYDTAGQALEHLMRAAS